APRPTATGLTPRCGFTAQSPARKSRHLAEIFSLSDEARRCPFSHCLQDRHLKRVFVMERNSIDRIFWDAAHLASPGERDAYLAPAWGEDLDRRQKVEQLLQARSKAENFLESPAANLVVTVQAPTGEGMGTVIGPYRLLHRLGEGGMGAVFR